MTEPHLDDRGFVLIEPTGLLTPDELMRLWERAVALTANQPGTPRVWDFSATDVSLLSGATLRDLVRRILPRDPEQGAVRVALVSTSDVAYGLSRMWQVFREGAAPTIAVFRDRDDAIAWVLGGVGTESG